ncbi:MAG: histidine kinase dimerization/phospho-acceptor domain-containing protein [Acutalibacteraceae bacterium]
MPCSKIANGSYTLKLPERGGYEFRELARNINVMSDSINENVEALRAIADGRKQFVDNFAHEMKTPLTSILGFADIMRVKRRCPMRSASNMRASFLKKRSG